MFYKLIFLTYLFFLNFLVQAQNQKPVAIIFDSDMGPDYDDAGAITLLHAFADNGEAEILATMASTKYEGVAGVLNVFNAYFSKPEIPVGVPKGEAVTDRDSQHWTDSLLLKYPHAINKNDEAYDAVELYRKILTAQPDSSVTIVTVGFLTNLSNLLKSKPDKYSAYNGEELVSKKVKKLVSMAGKFPEGKEFNIFMDAPASKYVFENWPVQVLFSGFEIGEKIKTGLPLIYNDSVSSPAKDVFRISIPQSAADSAGRMSWDETAVLVAVRGFQPFYNPNYGHIVVAEDGSNTWNDHGKKQAYLTEAEPFEKVQAIINQLMMHAKTGE